MIFVVDDDPAVRDSLRILFEAMGHSVEEFPSAATFLAGAVFGGNDCVVVVDIHMPGMTGIELLEHLRGAGNQVPVILVTGQPSPAMAARAQAAGAYAMLEKPFESAEILRLVERATKA